MISMLPSRSASLTEKFNFWLSRLRDVEHRGDGQYVACCPAHPDAKRSLWTRIGDKSIVATCFAGCSFPQICHAAGVTATWAFNSSAPVPVMRDVAHWIYRDELGDPVFRTVRREDGTIGKDGKKNKEFVQQRPDGNGGWLNGVKGVRIIPYRLTELWIPMGVVLIVEGEKHCDRLAEFGFTTTCNAGGAAVGNGKNKWKIEHSEFLRGRDVVILPDNDKPGREHARNVFKSLNGIAASVRIATLPGLPEKGDVIDFLNAGGTKEQIQEAIDNAKAVEDALPAEEPKRTQSDKRSDIQITPDEHIVVKETLEVLSTDPNLYKRTGQLVHVIQEESDTDEHGIVRSTGTPRILTISTGHLRERMTEHCYFFKWSENAKVHCSPPASIVNAIHTRGFWPQIRNLSGVTEIPVLRPDGTVLTSPGWDESTGLLFTPNGEIPQLPENPSKADALAAKELLLDVVSDFPFASPAHQSAWLAGLLTILARRAFTGPAPMFLVDANIRGSGKSMLTDVISLIATSRPMPRLSNPESDEETRKRITALAIAGDPLVLIDNIGGTLGSSSLDAVLTSTSWKDRRLGGNEIVEMPMRAVWFATGNNVVLTGDMSRRICHIRLDSLEENPEERSDFRHPKLLAYVRENRLQLLAAGLTVLRAFIVAGRPETGLKPWGSFEGWSDLIRNCLVWVGMDDPGGTRKELAEASDRDAGALRMLFECWSDIDPKGEGLSAADMVQLLDFHKRRRDCIDGGMTISVAESLIEKERQETEGAKTALCELCGVSDLTSKEVRKLGNQLKRFKGRVIGDHRLECRAQGRNKVNKWQVVKVDAVCAVSRGMSFSPSKFSQRELFNQNKSNEQGENNKERGTHTADAAHTAYQEVDDSCPNCGFETDDAGNLCSTCRN